MNYLDLKILLTKSKELLHKEILNFDENEKVAINTYMDKILNVFLRDYNENR